MKIAYIMSRFPKVTETFVLLEMLELRKHDVDLAIYPLIKPRAHVQHPEAQELMPRVHYTPFLSPGVLLANLRCMVAHPIRYWKTLWEVVSGTFGSWSFLAKSLAMFPKSVRIAGLMQRAGIEHVHAHFSTYPAGAALVVHRLSGIPFTFTAHGSDIHVEQRMLAEKIEASLGAVMISEYNRRFVLEKCGLALADKLHVIHCGIRPADYEQAGGGQSRADAPFSIICVASLNEVKGHTYLIEACRLLRERGVDFVCHLVGDGPLRGRITGQIAAGGLGDHVLLHGARTRGDVAALLAQADAAALTSVKTPSGRREGIPVVLMEAMASGLPVVASEISGISELVEPERAGLLVPPGQSGAIADALQRLSADPELRRRLGAAGRQKVRSEFAIEDTVAQLVRLWGSLNPQARSERSPAR